MAEAKQELEGDVEREASASRRKDALRIALYNVAKLELHMNQSRRILNDLRTLRRLLFEERSGKHIDRTKPKERVNLVAA